MQVGEDDVANLHAVRFGFVEILLHVALRIDDGGGPADAVTDEIRGMGEAVEVELLEDQHGSELNIADIPWRVFRGGSASH